MSWTLVAMGVVAITGAVTAYSQRQQGKAQQSYYNYLAGQANLNAKTAEERSQKQAELVGESASIQEKVRALQAGQLGAQQKAALAASGIDFGSVTSQDITADYLTKSKMDEMMIRRNANLNIWNILEQGKFDAWEQREQAKQYGYAGKEARRAGNIQAFTTLLGTASSLIGGAMLKGGASNAQGVNIRASGTGGGYSGMVNQPGTTVGGGMFMR